MCGLVSEKKNKKNLQHCQFIMSLHALVSEMTGPPNVFIPVVNKARWSVLLGSYAAADHIWLLVKVCRSPWLRRRWKVRSCSQSHCLTVQPHGAHNTEWFTDRYQPDLPEIMCLPLTPYKKYILKLVLRGLMNTGWFSNIRGPNNMGDHTHNAGIKHWW